MPRAKTWWPASARRSGSKRRSARTCPTAFKRTGRDRQEARSALPRRAGYRVHRAARQGLDAANPQRQADRLCRRADRGRPGQRRADRQGRRAAGQADSGRRPEPALAADLRSRIEAGRRQCRPAAGQGDQRRAGRRLGQDLLPRLRRRAGMAQGQQGQADPGPPRDQPRGSARHEDRPGHSHRLRRRQLARGPGQPPDGQGLHRRLRRTEHRLCRRHRHRQGQGAARPATRSRSTASPAKCSKDRSETRPSEILQVLITKTLAARARPRPISATSS